jgi:hypothetical protein
MLAFNAAAIYLILRQYMEKFKLKMDMFLDTRRSANSSTLLNLRLLVSCDQLFTAALRIR